jgi:hypothetical protein
MQIDTSRRGALKLGLLALASPAVAGLANFAGSSAALAQTVSPAMAEYRRRLREYTEARAAFDEEAGVYWSAISDKRRLRNAKRRNREPIGLDDYVLTHPPLYDGPKRPINPEPDDDDRPRPRRPIPVVADFVRSARDHFQFQPDRPGQEVDFKRAYARFARAAGLTREQAVRVYAFETGGNGTHDMQSGLNPSRPGSRAISTAIGYNQLLTTNSLELIAQQGPHLVRELSENAGRLQGVRRKAMDHKIAALKHMTAFARTVPDEWAAHERLAGTEQGRALHAMVLDVDVGPMLQTHKLLTSIKFARAKGYNAPLSAAELEMMNLTGDGTGFDMVTMPQVLRVQVPTSNFFQRGGYERNPVAIRHNTVAKLLAVTDARMDSASQAQGARDLAAAFQT